MFSPKRSQWSPHFFLHFWQTHHLSMVKQALCSWGHLTKFFLGNFYIMGYNLKNVRNGKSASKIAKWPSLSPLAFKSKFIWQFEFSENLEDLYGKCCWRARSCSPTTFFHTNLLILFKVQTVIKSHSLMMGATDLAILIFTTCFFHFWHLLSYSP